MRATAELEKQEWRTTNPEKKAPKQEGEFLSTDEVSWK